MKRLLIAAAAVLALGGGLAGCGTATPYQPLQTSGFGNGGYSEYQIASDRFRVSFQGNTLTDREQVERYLLFRAAELTVAQGYDWFSLVDRNTERDVQSRVLDNDPFGYDSWQPTYYVVSRGGQVYRVVSPTYFSSPFPRYQVQRTERFQANAEIFLGKGGKPDGDRTAFTAREVISNLGPSIVRPAA